jgi:hypothetical protein
MSVLPPIATAMVALRSVYVLASRPENHLKPFADTGSSAGACHRDARLRAVPLAVLREMIAQVVKLIARRVIALRARQSGGRASRGKAPNRDDGVKTSEGKGVRKRGIDASLPRFVRYAVKIAVRVRA